MISTSCRMDYAACRGRTARRAHGSLAGAFNASSIVQLDVYQKFQPRASQARLVGWDVATIVMVLIALLWIPVIQGLVGCTSICKAFRRISPADCSRVLPRCVHEAVECGWMSRRSRLWIRSGLFRLALDTPVTLGRRL